jgi:hypothetical protein
MSAMVSNRRSSFGISCTRCNSELMAPEWSENRNKQQIRHIWHCWKCDCCFETIVDIRSMENNIARDDILPSRLVA